MLCKSQYSNQGPSSENVPRITPIVDILRVPANRNRQTLSNPRIDGKDVPERIRRHFMIGQCPLGARLEGAVIASGRRIKCVDGAQDCVGIFGASVIVFVDACKDVLTIPIALQEAKDLRSLRYAART